MDQLEVPRPQPHLRSTESEIEVPVQFWNTTTRAVHIVWVDYHGNFIKYRTLDPRQGFAVNTFVTHPWIFLDAVNGDRCHVNLKDVFYPVSSEDSNYKKDMFITHPLLTLKSRTLRVLRDNVCDEWKVEQLDLPFKLKVDLSLLIRCKFQELRDVARNKWKNLKDTFRREHQKINKPPKSGSDGTVVKSNWAFYDSMLFSRDVIEPGVTQGNLEDPSYSAAFSQRSTKSLTPSLYSGDAPGVTQGNLEDPSYITTFSQRSTKSLTPTLYSGDEESRDKESELSGPSTKTQQSSTLMRISRQVSSTSTPRARSWKRKADYLSDRILKIEEKTLEMLADEKRRSDMQNDPDVQFMVSLVQYMKKLDPVEKLRLKSKLLNNVLDAVENNDQSSDS